jgi:hypothetical protein
VAHDDEIGVDLPGILPNFFARLIMGTIRRTINLIIALILVALGCGEFIAAIRHSPEN